MTRGRHKRFRPALPAEQANPWASFTTGELETKLAELRNLVDADLLTVRSLDRQRVEIGIIENELARRHGR